MNITQHKEAVRSYAVMWNENKPELASQILADTYIDHAHPELVGAKAIAAVVEKTLAAMPDFRIEISSVVAEADLVAFRETVTMTRAGAPLVLEGMSFIRFSNGKMVERWTSYAQNNA